MPIYQLTIKFEGVDLPTTIEKVDVPAENLQSARAKAPLYWTTLARGRLARIFDADGNELLGNH